MPRRSSLTTGLTDPRLHRLTWAIALPAIVANVSGPLVGVVDSWTMGHLGDPLYLAAIAAGGYAFHVLYWAFGFLRMGTTGLVAQAMGRGRPSEVARTIAAAVSLGMAVALVVVLLAPVLFAGLAQLLDLDQAVRTTAARYWDIRIWAAPAILVRLAMVGALIGLQAARSAMVVEVTLNLLNAGLTLLLVVHFGLGIAGAAWGSLIAEIMAVLLAAAFLVWNLRRRLALDIRSVLTASKTILPADLRLIAQVNGFIFLRTLLLLAAFGLFWRTSAALGTTVLAANQVAINLLMLTSFGLDGIAYAAEALVGEAVGRGQWPAVRDRILVTGLWSAVLAIGYTALWAASADALFAFFTAEPAVLAHARAVAGLVALLPLAGFLSYHMDGVFIGLAAARAMFATMAIAFAGYALTLGLALASAGNRGLWLALTVFLLLRGFAQLFWFLARGRRMLESPAGSGS